MNWRSPRLPLLRQYAPMRLLRSEVGRIDRARSKLLLDARIRSIEPRHDAHCQIDLIALALRTLPSHSNGVPSFRQIAMLIAPWHTIISFFLLFHVVSPLSSNINSSPRQLSRLHPVNSTAPGTTDATITPQTSLSALPILPHRFRVPTTKTVLHLGFGLLRHHVDPIEL